MRASALALAAALAAPAAAQDLGRPLSFPRPPAPSPLAAEAGDAARVLYDSGPSEQLAAPGDVVLFHGVSPGPGVRFQVRREGGGLSTPVALELRRRPNGRFWGRARLPGAGRVRIRALDDGRGAAGAVELLGAELADEGPEIPELSTSVARAPARPPVPDAPRPPVTPRAGWNARAPTEPYTPFQSIWRITLHHTDGRRTTSLQESLEEARFIQEFHQQGRRWIDIGYHFLVDELGHVIEGRPERVQGAHTLGENAGNVGIALLGKYHAAEDRAPSAAQLEAVARLARYLTLRHGIDPIAEFKGHRDHRGTHCPGDRAYAELSALRRRADGREAPAAATAAPRVASSLPGWAGLAPSWDGQRQAYSSAPPSASR